MQKNREELPVYKANHLNNKPPHKFTCKVTFTINGEKIEAKSIGEFSTKRAAEQNAAEQSLMILEKKYEGVYRLKSNDKNIHVLIDYENYNDDDKIDKFIKCNGNMNVTKYASIFNPRESTADIKVNSNRSDATDIKICCDVGVIFHTQNNPIVFVITRDHFASSLSDLYDDCYHVVSIDDCFNRINMLMNHPESDEK